MLSAEVGRIRGEVRRLYVPSSYDAPTNAELVELRAGVAELRDGLAELRAGVAELRDVQAKQLRTSQAQYDDFGALRQKLIAVRRSVACDVPSLLSKLAPTRSCSHPTHDLDE